MAPQHDVVVTVETLTFEGHSKLPASTMHVLVRIMVPATVMGAVQPARMHSVCGAMLALPHAAFSCFVRLLAVFIFQLDCIQLARQDACSHGTKFDLCTADVVVMCSSCASITIQAVPSKGLLRVQTYHSAARVDEYPASQGQL